MGKRTGGRWASNTCNSLSFVFANLFASAASCMPNRLLPACRKGGGEYPAGKSCPIGCQAGKNGRREGGRKGGGQEDLSPIVRVMGGVRKRKIGKCKKYTH